MAIAVIGGLISSTLLSLVFVPAVFAVMDDVANLGWRIFSRFVGPRGRRASRHQRPMRIAYPRRPSDETRPTCRRLLPELGLQRGDVG